jgi:hypothetical protein
MHFWVKNNFKSNCNHTLKHALKWMDIICERKEFFVFVFKKILIFFILIFFSWPIIYNNGLRNLKNRYDRSDDGLKFLKFS